MSDYYKKITKNFLNVYWLRPESALSHIVRSKSIYKYLNNIIQPSIDIAGGDGIVSFIACGGELSDKFDVYSSVGNLGDFYEKKADIYDHFDEDMYSPEIIVKPDNKFKYNLDWKLNLLNKSKKLQFYNEYIEHNFNNKFKFEDSYFNFIFSNSIYWASEIDQLLKEIYRIANKDAIIMFHVKNDLQKKETFRDLNKLDDKIKFILDRGRMESYPSLASHEEWLNRFKNNNFAIEETVPTFTKDHRNIMDVGLRPFSPFLIEMANELDEIKKMSIKKKWVNLSFDLIDSISEPGSNIGIDSRAAEYLYVLRKK
jgi:SAM-dependent methyltransferase